MLFLCKNIPCGFTLELPVAIPKRTQKICFGAEITKHIFWIFLYTWTNVMWLCEWLRPDWPAQTGYLLITKTCLYNIDPLKSHFCIVKLGFTGVYIIFLISAQKTDCGYSLEPPRRGGSNEYLNLCFDQKYEKYPNFYLKIFSFWWLKCAVYLNRHVFVMCWTKLTQGVYRACGVLLCVAGLLWIGRLVLNHPCTHLGKCSFSPVQTGSESSLYTFGKMFLFPCTAWVPHLLIFPPNCYIYWNVNSCKLFQNVLASTILPSA